MKILHLHTLYHLGILHTLPHILIWGNLGGFPSAAVESFACRLHSLHSTEYRLFVSSILLQGFQSLGISGFSPYHHRPDQTTTLLDC